MKTMLAYNNEHYDFFLMFIALTVASFMQID